MRWPAEDTSRGDNTDDINHQDNTDEDDTDKSQDKSQPQSRDNEPTTNFIGPQILAQERRISVETFHDQMHFA